MSQEAMKLALEALRGGCILLENYTREGYEGEFDDAITALREALAEQPAQQEPVAYWIPKAEQFCIASPSGRPFAKAWEPLYTSPPAQRKPLTEHQTMSMTFNHHWLTSMTLRDAYRLGIRDAEAAHGIRGEQK